MAKEQRIWDKKKEAVKSEKKAKKLALPKFHKWIYIFRKKVSERISTKKAQNHEIEVKKEFIPRKEKIYLFSREKREEVYEFIGEQLRKGYIKLLKLSQIALVFFIGKKNNKKYIT